jgi:hypothetical protein
MFWPGIEWASAVGGEHSRKEPLKQLLQKLFGTSTYEPVTWLLLVYVVTYSYMNTHELHWYV